MPPLHRQVPPGRTPKTAETVGPGRVYTVVSIPPLKGNEVPDHRPLATMFCLLATLGLAALPARAQDQAEPKQPAETAELSAIDLTPIDTAAFIHIQDPARQLELLADEPLLAYVQKKMKWDNFDGLQKLLAAMEMSREDLFKTYFAQNLVVFGTSLEQGMLVPVEVDDGQGGRKIEQKEMSGDEFREHIRGMTPQERQKFFEGNRDEDPDTGYQQAPPEAVFFTEAEPEELQKAVTKLELLKTGKVGDFDTYKNRKGDALFAVYGRWLGICAPQREEYFKKVLLNVGDEKSLARNDDYQAWIAQLPEKRMATVYIRPANASQAHVAALTHTSRSTTVHYVGYSAFTDQLIDKLGDVEKLDFGPLPKQTVAAYAVNARITDMLPPGAGNQLGALDQFFAPKSFRNDILPALDAPTIIFIGEVPRQQLDPDPGFDMPVVGIAVKLKDREIAKDFDNAGNAILTLANIALLAAEKDPVKIQQVNHAGTTLRSIDLGPLLAMQQRGEQWQHAVKLTYGRINDWYMVCSNAMFFKHGILSRPGDFGVIRGGELSDFKPMLRLFVNPQRLSEMFKHWSESDTLRGMLRMDATASTELADFSEMALQYEYLDASFHRRDDDIIVGKVDLIRKQTDSE